MPSKRGQQLLLVKDKFGKVNLVKSTEVRRYRCNKQCAPTIYTISDNKIMNTSEWLKQTYSNATKIYNTEKKEAIEKPGKLTRKELKSNIKVFQDIIEKDARYISNNKSYSGLKKIIQLPTSVKNF